MFGHLPQPLVAHGDVSALGPGQLVPEQRERRVRVPGLVGDRRGKVLQFVEALAGDLQPHRLHDLVEQCGAVVDVVDAVESAALEGLGVAAPGVPLPGAEQHLLIVRAQGHRLSQRLDRLRPERDAVEHARLAPVVPNAREIEVDHGRRHLAALLGAEAAVEGEVDDGPELHELLPGLFVAHLNQPFDAEQDAPDLRRGVQLPLHARLRAPGQLGDGLVADADVAAPTLIGGVAAGVAQLADGPFGEVRLPVLGQPLVDGAGCVGGPVVGQPMPGHVVDAAGAELVLRKLRQGELAALRIVAPVQEPARQDVADRHLPDGPGLGFRQGGVPVADRRRLPVIDLDRLRHRHAAGDPLGALADAALVAAPLPSPVRPELEDEGQGAPGRQFWGRHRGPFAYGACVRRGGKARLEPRQGRFSSVSHTPNSVLSMTIRRSIRNRISTFVANVLRVLEGVADLPLRTPHSTRNKRIVRKIVMRRNAQGCKRSHAVARAMAAVRGAR